MRTLMIGTLLWGGIVSSLGAQSRWTLTGELGMSRFSRAAHDTSTPVVALGAWSSSSYTIRLAREGEKAMFGLSLGYTSSPLAAWVENVAVLQGGELALLELATTYGRWVVRTGRGAALRLEFGPVMDIWTMSGEDPRTRLGAMAGAALALPVTETWRVEVRSDLTITGSLFRPEDEDDEITRDKTMRRGRLALGITRRL